jgi:hypothetical protein
VALAADGSDAVIGTYDFDSATFTPGSGGSGVAAMRVEVRRDQDSAAGPLRLFLGHILGVGETNVDATATAALRKRDLVIVQDRTVSFTDTFDSAIEADLALLDVMASQQLGGDRVGLVTFARDAIEEAPLTELTASGRAMLESTISAFEVCQTAGPPGGPCYGTDISVGIDRAREIFERDSTDGTAERVMVVVTDGLPCIAELPGNAKVDVGQAWATVAADAAGALGITIFVVTLDQNDGRIGICYGQDVEFNESLARGFGSGYTTTEEEDLDNLLVSILRQMPVRLIE